MLIPRHILKCVCFICAYGPAGPIPVGTGFFMAVPVETKTGTRRIAVVVTALHVISEIETNSTDQRIALRVNTQEGGVEYVDTYADNWVKPDHADGFVDAAVCDFPFNNADRFDFNFLEMKDSATTEIIKSRDLGIGNNVYFAGLFINHYGAQRNEPIMRSGMLAAMPTEKIRHRNLDWNAYLVEGRSIGGLSGSPVFVEPDINLHQGGTLIVRMPGAQAWFLLGIMRGHWDELMDDDTASEDALHGSKHEAVNMGIAMVIPIDHVLPLINECAQKTMAALWEKHYKVALENELEKRRNVND